MYGNISAMKKICWVKYIFPLKITQVLKKKIPEIMEGINLVSVLSAKSLRVAILKARLYISCVKKGD